MVQMCGVSLLALGIPAIFGSFEHGGVLHNEVMVSGYVIMRVALVAQFLRAAARDGARRSGLLIYVAGFGLAQVGWVALIIVHVTLPSAIFYALPLYALEILGPWAAERHNGLPWHAHHIAERYSLLTIISLGEGVVGTIGALSVLVARGWNLDAVVLLTAGMAVTFGMWWCYFLLPMGEVLHVRRHKSVVFYTCTCRSSGRSRPSVRGCTSWPTCWTVSTRASSCASRTSARSWPSPCR